MLGILKIIKSLEIIFFKKDAILCNFFIYYLYDTQLLLEIQVPYSVEFFPRGLSWSRKQYSVEFNQSEKRTSP